MSKLKKTDILKWLIPFIGAVYFSPISHAQVTNGLYAEYLFDDATANTTAGSIDGIISNAYPAEDRFGCPNHAMEFVSADESYIGFGDNFDQYFATADSSFSFSLWFKLKNEGLVSKTALNKNGHSGCSEEQREFHLSTTPSGELIFYYFSTPTWGNLVGIKGATIISDTLWHHVVINYDGSLDGGSGMDRVEIYLDNNPESLSIDISTGTLGNIQNGTAHLGLGAALNSSGGYCATSASGWHGYLDDLKLYSRTLEAFEVDLLYNVDSSCCAGLNDSIGVDTGVITVYQLGSTYQWIDCGTMTPIVGEINQFYFPDAAGTYACIIDLNGCIDTTECVEYCVEIDTDIEVDNEVLSVSQLGALYQWINCSSGLAITGENNQFFIPSDTGAYACIITIGSCSDTTDCEQIVGLGFDEFSSQAIQIYPNPSHGIIHLNLTGIQGVVELTIIDTKGSEVYFDRSIPVLYKMNLSNLEEGMYFVRLQTTSGIITKRISLIK